MGFDRIYNFSAGPSMLPEKVLEIAAKEMLNYGGSGMSVMEMSHRSKVYDSIIKETEASLRRVMGIPDNYKVLFIQGGASMQFNMVPQNLMTKSGTADYAVTGYFAKKAAAEAKKIGTVNVVATSEDVNFSKLPEFDTSKFNPDADYFYICTNNTIFGTSYKTLPDTKGVPIVADMSSNILSEEIDVSKYGLIFAGAQKNMGPAGLTVVIIREDLIYPPQSTLPTMLEYKTYADNESMYNTPPTYAIYVCKLVLEWLEKDIGGLKKMGEINTRKANLLYNYLDKSKMFNPTAKKSDRSIMNVTFKTTSEELDAKFASEAAKAGFVNLKGHRLVGGMRASIYNAMPEEGIEKLVEFMRKFEESNS